MRILTGVKRASANHGHKNNTKRSYLSEGQSSITHTGSPVNPMTAKILASKLNERNNLLNGTKKGTMHGTQAPLNTNGTAIDIPVPPLISIQTAPATNRFKDDQDPPQSKCSHVKHLNAQTDASSKPIINEKPQKSTMSSKQFDGTNSAHHSKSVRIKVFIYELMFGIVSNWILILIICEYMFRLPVTNRSPLRRCINVNFAPKNSIRYVIVCL